MFCTVLEDRWFKLRHTLNNWSPIYQQISESLNYFFFLLHQKTVGSVFAHVLSFFRKTRWNKVFFVPVLVLWVFWDLLPILNNRWYKNSDACTHRTKVCCLLAYAISFESLGGWLHLTVLILTLYWHWILIAIITLWFSEALKSKIRFFISTKIGSH